MTAIIKIITPKAIAIFLTISCQESNHDFTESILSDTQSVTPEVAFFKNFALSLSASPIPSKKI